MWFGHGFCQQVLELLLIEEESRNLKLDQIAAISMYFEGDSGDLALAKFISGQVVRG
jgi:hypothetical protein